MSDKLQRCARRATIDGGLAELVYFTKREYIEEKKKRTNLLLFKKNKKLILNQFQVVERQNDFRTPEYVAMLLGVDQVVLNGV